MATLTKAPSVNLEIDNGLDHGSVFSRDELIAMLAVLEADIKTKQKERDELRQYAVDAGEAHHDPSAMSLCLLQVRRASQLVHRVRKHCHGPSRCRSRGLRLGF